MPAPKKAIMESSLGMFSVSEGVGDVVVGVAGATVCGKEDSFRISIPNAQRDESQLQAYGRPMPVC